MTREQLDALEKLAKKATPGPWWVQREYDGGRTVCQMRHQTETVCVNKASHVDGDPWDAHLDNANLIEALRNNATELLALARRALELEEALEWFAKQGDSELDEFRGIYSAKCWVGGNCEDRRYGEGATPLEAIQKAQRGK